MVDLDVLEVKKKNYAFIIIFLIFWSMIIVHESLFLDDNDHLWWLIIVIYDLLWFAMIGLSIFCYIKGRAYWFITVSFNNTLGIPLANRRQFVMHKLVRNCIGTVLFTAYAILALIKRFPFTYTISSMFFTSVLIYGSGLGLKKYLVDPNEDDSIVDDNFRY